MKQRFAVLLLLGAMFVTLGDALAVPFVGTPNSSTTTLSPVFGTLIDFDDQATGTAVLANDYVAQGVASITETEGLGFFARYAGSQSLPNYIGTGFNGERGTDSNAGGFDGTILIEFLFTASQVGIGIADSAGDPESLRIFDSGFNLLETVSAPAGLNTYAGFSRASADIKYFEIQGDFFALDDLQHDAPIPEPGSLALLGSGLLGLAGTRRRRA